MTDAQPGDPLASFGDEVALGYGDGIAGAIREAFKCPVCHVAYDRLPLGHSLATPLDGGTATCMVMPAVSPADFLAAGGRELRWHYGPTAADPDPGKMWCYGCGSEVWAIDDGWWCTGCQSRVE